VLQQTIRVLLIEDREEDYLLTRRMLSAIEDKVFDLKWAASYDEGIEAFRLGLHDVCLLDYRLGDRDGLELLEEYDSVRPKAPVILLTGTYDYGVDLAAMRLGAADFLVKDQITPSLLERAIRYAIQQSQTLHELQRQQDGLRASEVRFRSVVQSAPDAIIVSDNEGKIIFWNSGAERIFGYSEDEILQRPIEVLMPVRYRETHRVGVERLHTTGNTRLIGNTVELEGLRQDGTEFPLELSLASWSTSDGTFFTGILRDITEQKRSQAKSQFMARMSHELRTPLHAIMGFTNMLRANKSGNLTREDLDYVERILANATDQLRLINGVLDLSKLEAGKVEVRSGAVEVDTLIREVAKQFAGNRPNPDVDVIVRIPDDVHPIQSDGPKLKQVIMNLVENALKFTEHGSVTIEVPIDPSTSMPVRIDVKDTGIGIPAEQLKKIFEPFHQLELAEGARSAEGTGLGLSISRSICDLLGYDLRVQSEPGSGSTFSIVLTSETNLLPLSA
jgi:PAS domain S-box-containing protein